MENNDESQKAVIDLEIINKTTKGNRELIEKMVDMFLKTTPDLLAKLQQCFDEKNYAELRTHAHSCKPMYTYLGMPQLSEIVGQIEINAAEEKKMDETQLLINELVVKSKKGLEELKELVK